MRLKTPTLFMLTKITVRFEKSEKSYRSAADENMFSSEVLSPEHLCSNRVLRHYVFLSHALLNKCSLLRFGFITQTFFNYFVINCAAFVNNNGVFNYCKVDVSG